MWQLQKALEIGLMNNHNGYLYLEEISLEKEILKNHKGDKKGNEAWYWRLWKEIEWKALVAEKL